MGKPGEDGDKGGQVGRRSTKKTLTDFICTGYFCVVCEKCFS